MLRDAPKISELIRIASTKLRVTLVMFEVIMVSVEKILLSIV